MDEFNYWEKQLILYAKFHYGIVRYSYNELRLFSSKMYKVNPEQISQYNIDNMVLNLLQKLIDNNFIEITISEFTNLLFNPPKYAEMNDTISRKTVNSKILSLIQNMIVQDTSLELGQVDVNMKLQIEHVNK